MLSKPKLRSINKIKTIFRVDADKKIGMGHFMRSFALSQSVKKIGNALFITSSNQNIRKKLENEQIPLYTIKGERGSLKDAAETAKIVKKHGADWLVLDGYHFNSTYQEYIHSQGVKILLVDDVGQKERYCANLILNQNIYADRDLYQGAQKYTKLLLGCKYTLLRNEFSCWKNWKREIPVTAQNLMITLGGSDPKNVLGMVIEGLKRLENKDLNIRIVAGQLNPYFEELKKRISSVDRSITLMRHIDDMPKQIASSDIVLCAGGSTCYELAFMATPFVTIVIAENQIRIAEHLEKVGASINLGWFENLSPVHIAETISKLTTNQAHRVRLSSYGKKLIDGRGAENVIDSMLNYH